MVIPIGTDRPNKRRPVVNEALITINLLVYLVGVAGLYFGWLEFGTLQAWGHYDPRDIHAWQLITYQFLHSPHDIWHILFNMVFLWVFGNAVEDRLGHVGYLGFYLMAGTVAGVVHGMATPAPIIGASGSIAGVSGAFLALFPRAHVRIIFFLFGIFSIPALWFIGFYFALDVVNQVFAFGGGATRVAYMAHIAGYIYGFFLCFALLALKILKREEFDVFFLFKQMRRRKAFRSTVERKAGVWDAPKADTPERATKRKGPRPFTAQQKRYAEQRAEISRLLADHQSAEAARKYRELLQRQPDAVMPEPRQLDLANQLYAEGDIENATRAYELLLDTYPTCRDATEVKLILGVIYTRRQPDPQRARELLEDVKPRLRGESEKQLADELLDELSEQS